jgi:hypothetical protein
VADVSNQVDRKGHFQIIRIPNRRDIDFVLRASIRAKMAPVALLTGSVVATCLHDSDATADISKRLLREKRQYRNVKYYIN